MQSLRSCFCFVVLPLFHSKSKTRRDNTITVADSAVTGTGAVLADSQQAKRVRAVVCRTYVREAVMATLRSSFLGEA
jgi:hypothetical protein